MVLLKAIVRPSIKMVLKEVEPALVEKGFDFCLIDLENKKVSAGDKGTGEVKETGPIENYFEVVAGAKKRFGVTEKDMLDMISSMFFNLTDTESIVTIKGKELGTMIFKFERLGKKGS